MHSMIQALTHQLAHQCGHTRQDAARLGRLLRGLPPLALAVGFIVAWCCSACTASETQVTQDFGFDGTCVNCHAGLRAGHVHPGYKLRCVDCHGGNDQLEVPVDAHTVPAQFRAPALVAAAHVRVQPELAKFFWANGVDDDGDGKVDEGPTFTDLGGGNQKLTDAGELFEPGLHGEGAGEFIDVELSRDLNYLRFINPGDLRVATIGCGSKNRAALDGGGGGGCHQQTVDTVRRSIMVNQTAVINGAYYGNESWRQTFIAGRDAPSPAADPRAAAFGYTLDYAGVDACIVVTAASDGTGGKGGRGQAQFDRACLQQRAAMLDPAVAANALNNKGLPAFEMAQAKLSALLGLPATTTIANVGAGRTRYPWGGKPVGSAAQPLTELKPVPQQELLPGVPDPVDVILRTFRAYYPVNYPGSTTNFNGTFGTSILPEAARFTTANPYGRSHAAGCTSCHARYNFDGSRNPTLVRNDDGTQTPVVDPTTKHREFVAAEDVQTLAGVARLIGRVVTAAQREQTDKREQQRSYSADHQLTTRVDTDNCGHCHGFVTRVNMAYQGMAEDEQRNPFARRAPLRWTTPKGTKVQVLDSWVREEVQSGTPVVIRPAGVAVIAAAQQRDATLAAQGLLPGAGGCAAATYSEDCNNNGELDAQVFLERRNEAGDVIAQATINEDSNGNGLLDLPDHAPREKSIDGRQAHYVYGGRNGSTRQMDVHFERGMHCIDCHFIQDVHGDGHMYGTNWEAIEIECEDCHGATERSKLLTSGLLGGNDLTQPKNPDGKPYFERQGDTIIQRSRVTPGLFWRVPQTAASADPVARLAHSGQHLAAPGQGSTFAGAPGASELTSAKLECQSCHSSWVLSCMGCHADLNLGDPIRKSVQADGTIVKSAGENETWLSNTQTPGHINFALLGFLRSPYVLGIAAAADAYRAAPFRSSMQVHVNVTDGTGHTLVDSATFTTFQNPDANSGRRNVATSGVAMNQTMPHTVRPREAKGCETCHALVDRQGRVLNEPLLGQTLGVGVGSYPYLGDWVLAAGTGGLELVEYKQERELIGNKPGASNRFPGMIVNGSAADRVAGKVEPVFDGTGGLNAAAVATDVVLVRNFNATPPSGATRAPTLRDLAVATVEAGGNASLLITDVSGRGHPSSARTSVGNTARNFRLALPGANARALAHLSPDVSDPFVYVANGTAGLVTVELRGAPSASVPAAVLRGRVALPAGRDATEVALAGDAIYVGTQQGTIEVFSLAVPTAPAHAATVTVGSPVVGLAVGGFVLYAATPNGLAIYSIATPLAPQLPVGASNALAVPGINARELSVYGNSVFIAAGAAGVFEIDVSVPALPVSRGNIAAVLAPGQPINANDVVISRVPGQTWLMVADVTGDVWGLKLDNTQTVRERCFPDPRGAGCLSELDFLDPTISGRDPSFDPVTQSFDAADPSGARFVRLSGAIVANARHLARPAWWEQLGTVTGRRLRDSFMPGSGVLSLPVMQKMRNVQICEDANAPGWAASGRGALGLADATFFATGVCASFGAKHVVPGAATPAARGGGARAAGTAPADAGAAAAPEPAMASPQAASAWGQVRATAMATAVGRDHQELGFASSAATWCRTVRAVYRPKSGPSVQRVFAIDLLTSGVCGP